MNKQDQASARPEITHNLHRYHNATTLKTTSHTRRTPGRTLVVVFCGWVFSIAFYQYPIVGNLSIDNIAAPLLLLVGIFAFLSDKVYFARTIKFLVPVVLLFAVYFVGQVVAVVAAGDLLLSKLWTFGRNFGYVLIPILLVRRIESFYWAASALMVVAAVVSVSGILSSLGLVSFPVERFQESRLGVDAIPKAIGLFTAYGDVAQCVAWALLISMWVNRRDLPLGLGTLPVRFIVWCACVVGFVGFQSRNIVLTSALALLVFWGVSWMFGKRGSGLRLVLALALLLILSSIALVLSGSIFDAVRSAGGEMAAQTVDGRIQQYKTALTLFFDAPILGVGGEVYAQNREFINSVHNFWLLTAVRGGSISVLGILGVFFFVGVFALQMTRVKPEDPMRRHLLAVLVASFFASNFYVAGGTVVFWLILGYAVALAGIIRAQTQL